MGTASHLGYLLYGEVLDSNEPDNRPAALRQPTQGTPYVHTQAHLGFRKQ